jgi:hypothetical protein
MKGVGNQRGGAHLADPKEPIIFALVQMQCAATIFIRMKVTIFVCTFSVDYHSSL